MVSVLMERSWFGPKNESGGGAGIASWQGAVVTVVCFGGAFAAEKFIPGGLRHLAAGGLIAVFAVIYWATYDKDAIT
jgi:hypothetical protein